MINTLYAYVNVSMSYTVVNKLVSGQLLVDPTKFQNRYCLFRRTYITYSKTHLYRSK